MGFHGTQSILPHLTAKMPYDAAKDADAAVLVTEWDVLRALDLKRLAAIMAQSVFIDLRNIYPAEEMENAGFRWHGVGRTPST